MGILINMSEAIGGVAEKASRCAALVGQAQYMESEVIESVIWKNYLNYLRRWAEAHSGVEHYGWTPRCFDVWYGGKCSRTNAPMEIFIE